MLKFTERRQSIYFILMHRYKRFSATGHSTTFELEGFKPIDSDIDYIVRCIDTNRDFIFCYHSNALIYELLDGLGGFRLRYRVHDSLTDYGAENIPE